MTDSSDFNDETFRMFQRDLDTGRLPTDKVFIRDPDTPGLAKILRAGQNPCFSVNYAITRDGVTTRPYWSLDNYPEISIPTARLIAKLFRALAAQNIDPLEAMEIVRKPAERLESTSVVDSLSYPENVLPFPPRK